MPPLQERNGITMDLSVNGATITLSSLNNTGVSFQQSQEHGFDLDFKNFTGKLRVVPHMSANEQTDDDGRSFEQEQVIAQDHDHTVERTGHQSIVEEVDICKRLHECIRNNATTPLAASSTTASSAPLQENELHVACSRPNVTIKELSIILNTRPEAANETDEEGRYPLHVFSQNTSLLASFVDYPRSVQTFAMSLLKAYPEALFYRDSNGNVPFCALIQDWITDQYDSTLETRSGIVETVIGSKAARSRLAIVTSTSNNDDPYVNKFPQVSISPAVVTGLKTLSTYLNCINESDTASRESQLYVRATLAQQYATIPYLLKTLNLIIDDDVRLEIISIPMIRRILYCSESVGQWLSNMLRVGGLPSKRAVDYLQDVSKITVSDYAGVTAPSDQDMEAFDLDQLNLFSTVESTGQIVPSLTTLNEKEKGRAATTNVVWTIINQSISRPLVIGIQSADFVFNVLLILVFRYATGTNNLVLSGTTDAFSIQTAKVLVLSLCIYFLVRKASEFYSLLRMSPGAFKSYLLDFWNFIDVGAIIMATAAVTTQNESGVFLALTMAMLWLKFLAYLTAVNMYLATFIMAVVEIVKDIKWFLVVLVLSIFMFGDVIQIITQQSVEDYCGASEPPPEEFCSSELGPMFLKMFAVLVGDMDLNEFKYSSGIQILFVLFALLGIVILLNVLIAVVSDSYQKSVEHSMQLFGRARLDFVVKMVAQEQLLRGNAFPSCRTCGPVCLAEYSLWFISLTGRLIVLVALVWTAVISEYCLVLLAKATIGESAWWVFCATVAGLLFLLSIPLVLQDLIERPLRKFAKDHGLVWIIAYLDATNRAGQKCAKIFFGGTGPLNDELEEEGDVRFQRMENSMERIASSTKEEINQSVEAVEHRVVALSSQTQSKRKDDTEP